MKISNRWTTFQGKHVTLDTIDQQHLSNIYWFFKIIWDNKFESDLIIDELSERFNGQILPYRPHIRFTTEIDTLKNMGCLKKINEKYFEIIFEDEKVGEIRKP